MTKNQQTVNEPIEDALVGNLEVAERQLTYLATIKSYLESQLDQVQSKMDEIAESIKHKEVE